MAEAVVPPPFANLTISTRGVVDVAAQWAALNSRATINSVDLLIGVALAHEDESPLLVLLRHFYIDISEFYARIDFDPLKLPPSRPSVALNDVGDTEVWDIFYLAYDLARKFNTRDKPTLTRLDDLFGALISTGTQAAKLLEQALSSTGTNLGAIAGAYAQFLDQQSSASPLSWKKFLHQRFPYLPPEALRRAVTGFGADTQGGRDLVGIGAEVDAFAYLITARALHPPLAVGLFGDWGAGKTYFMRALQDRIHQITAEARASGKPQKSISVYKYVVQIEFNAWHYVEGELWASLVEHIFNNLQTSPKERPGLLEQRQKYWADRMSANRIQILEVQKELEKIERQIALKQSRIREIERDRDEKEARMESLRAINPWDEIKLTDEVKKQWDLVLKETGLDHEVDTAAQFAGAFQEFMTMYREGKELAVLLRRRGWGWYARLTLALLSGPALSGIVSLISADRFPLPANFLLGISTFLSVGAVVLRQGAAEARQLVNKVRTAQQALDVQKADAEARIQTEIQKIAAEIEPLQTQYLNLTREKEVLVETSRQIEEEARGITPRRVMLDFIRERVGSSDYRKWLGVPALIRRDFEQLSDLILDTNQELLETDTGQVQTDSHNINRIVLFIDDLDRCPPEKVAKVLQAVHLLLAFPLFVVVVAVDARWLSQSLKQYYGELLASSPDETQEKEGEFAPRATPQDYLEKIFQIPYWVPSLSNDARFNIVQGLVQASLKRMADIEEGIQPDLKKKEGALAAGMQSVEALAQRLRENSPAAPPVFDKARPITDTPPGLEIVEPELLFMSQLKTLLGATPRSVKRFVNVYWLMKSIALARPSPRRFFGEELDAGYKLVLFLLAVLTGLSGIEHEFFAALCLDPSDCSSRNCPHDTLNDLVVFLETGVGPSPNPEEEDPARRDLRRLRDWIETYEQGAWKTLKVSLLSAWATEVARFSYRMERV